MTSVRAITEAFAVAEDAAAVSVASRALAFFLASDEAPTGDVRDRLEAARDEATARIRAPAAKEAEAPSTAAHAAGAVVARYLLQLCDAAAKPVDGVCGLRSHVSRAVARVMCVCPCAAGGHGGDAQVACGPCTWAASQRVGRRVALLLYVCARAHWRAVARSGDVDTRQRGRRSGGGGRGWRRGAGAQRAAVAGATAGEGFRRRYGQEQGAHQPS